ncbi:proteobacterial dedicated sortase system histidine kinase [Saccharophagus degradans]|uniref:histidine kinase n=1 Tax=Saccharophagus degradans (strain 2-40 / ATCC 43961 / DSM 17024) TaxID=203122 RepID=Q21M02_SACD2|nr:proteobacterial dedicated sortase system histidine kinase [Saccharophagus degradans]ABD80277.1 ATP-binding region, ATPase-like protein [Saccharophagus degradans 2-40]
MRLRKQLFFVSLITLTLPWAGCQYVKEMEQTLRTGQSEALTATAMAAAARLSSDPAAVMQLQQLGTPAGLTPLYAHPMATAVVPDGYDDEWVTAGLARQGLAAPSGEKAQIVAGSYQRSLYLFLRSYNNPKQYYSPSQRSPIESDHLRIKLRNELGQEQTLLVYTSVPGRASVDRLIENNRTVAEHKVICHWLEWQDGYHIELELPLTWAKGGIEVYLTQALASDASKQALLSNRQNNQTALIAPLITPSEILANELAIFSRTGVQLHVASSGVKRLASTGNLNAPASKKLKEQHGLISWLYTLALGNDKLPELDNVQTSGQFETPEVSLALQNTSAQGVYQKGAKRLLRVAVPILANGDKNAQPLGVVIADQNADSLATMTNSAFNRLIMYSLGTVFIAAFALIIYASWISMRIGRLSQAAVNAVSETGKISDDFPILNSKDEVGDLSRSFGQLLARLREYTHYLRTLSSKLSHELRTPLAIVRSSLDNLEHVKLSKEAKVYAERAREGTLRLSSILNSMSAASRVEQAISGADIEDIPANELLSSLKAAYEDVYKHVDFKLNIRDDGQDFTLRGSGELLVQMLDKLVDNAADFCPQQGLIELGLYRNNNHIMITVRNDGPPLPSHMHGQLFDSMVSVRDKTDERQHHLGLGLYIVRLIVDFHRGEVQGYNIPDNSGVIFEIKLPVKGS